MRNGKRSKAERAEVFRVCVDCDDRAESILNPTVAKITSRSDCATRELLSGVIREGQQRGQVDAELDPESVSAVIHSIIFGLNRLGAISNSAFDLKAASAMLKLLIERFLRPQSIRTPNKPDLWTQAQAEKERCTRVG